MVSAAAANDVIYLDEERDATGTEQVPLLFDFSPTSRDARPTNGQQ